MKEKEKEGGRKRVRERNSTREGDRWEGERDRQTQRRKYDRDTATSCVRLRKSEIARDERKKHCNNDRDGDRTREGEIVAHILNNGERTSLNNLSGSQKE